MTEIPEDIKAAARELADPPQNYVIEKAILAERSRSQAEIERLREALQKADRIMAYPVDTSITRRGWDLRPEKDLEYGVKLIRKALEDTN